MLSKRINVSIITPILGTLYPPPFDQNCQQRERRALGDASGLTQFGVNLLSLPPGTWSSQRHWHKHQDEFIYIVAGEVILCTDTGDEKLKAGDAAGFKAGDSNGHCLRNESNEIVLVLEIGTRTSKETVHYSDIDMIAHLRERTSYYARRNGTPYNKKA